MDCKQRQITIKLSHNGIMGAAWKWKYSENAKKVIIKCQFSLIAKYIQNCLIFASIYHVQSEENDTHLVQMMPKYICIEKETCFISFFKTTEYEVRNQFTCREVMDPLCPCSTATGAQVRRHHTRMVLSQLPAAINVFS